MLENYYCQQIVSGDKYVKYLLEHWKTLHWGVGRIGARQKRIRLSLCV